MIKHISIGTQSHRQTRDNYHEYRKRLRKNVIAEYARDRQEELSDSVILYHSKAHIRHTKAYSNAVLCQ